MTCSENEVRRDEGATAQRDVRGRVGHRRCDGDHARGRLLFHGAQHAVVGNLLASNATSAEEYERRRRERCRR